MSQVTEHTASNMVVVSSSEFRKNQKAFLDRAEQGESIVIERGERAYALVPISDDDVYYTPEMEARILKSIKEAEEGNKIVLNSAEDIKNLLGL
jgi:antitoxin (DNA-binding transcriptional repressor) of toxin-antitoxin stability system